MYISPLRFNWFNLRSPLFFWVIIIICTSTTISIAQTLSSEAQTLNFFKSLVKLEPQLNSTNLEELPLKEQIFFIDSAIKILELFPFVSEENNNQKHANSSFFDSEIRDKKIRDLQSYRFEKLNKQNCLFAASLLAEKLYAEIQKVKNSEKKVDLKKEITPHLSFFSEKNKELKEQSIKTIEDPDFLLFADVLNKFAETYRITQQDLSALESLIENYIKKNNLKTSNYFPPIFTKIGLLSSFEVCWSVYEYTTEKLKLEEMLLNEKAFFSYQNSTGSIISNYNSIKSQIWKTKSKLEHLDLSLSFPVNSQLPDKTALKNLFLSETAFLNQHEAYCNLRIESGLKYDAYTKGELPRYVYYKGGVIPLFEQSPTTVTEPNFYVTIKVAQDKNQDLYITGFQKLRNKKPFIAKVRNQKVVWLTFLNLPEKELEKIDSYGALIHLSDDNCFAVVHSSNKSHTTQISQNTLVELSKRGAIKKSLGIGNNSYPVGILFNEKDSTFLSASERVSYNWQIPQQSILLKKIKFDGSVIWESDLKLKGSLAKVAPLENDYVVVCNKSSHEKRFGPQIQTPVDPRMAKSSIYLVKVSKDGKVLKTKEIEADQALSVSYVSVMENNSMLLMGSKKQGKKEQPNRYQLDLFDVVINEELEVQYSSL